MTIPDRLSAALADRYRIEHELGAGGMATVYLAADLKHDRKVAIKVLKPELAAVLGAERFVQEIKTTAALSHPHILPLFDSGEAGGFLYYVMPYIEGETIRDRLNRETQLGVEEAVKITTEIADALDYAHRHGVIHRDIKPENILLHDGRPMVMDFGIALAVSAAAGGRMTETGLSLGTPHYMSPEQATADKQITARSDVYSLASVLYELLAGEPPHTAGSAQAIIMKIIAEPVQPVTALRKSVPPNVAAAVAKALEKVPADRFASAKDFADALANPAFEGEVTRAHASAGRPTMRSAMRPFALGVVATAALALLFVVLRDRTNRPPAPVVRAAVDIGQAVVLSFRISPDGSRIVFSNTGATTLFFRDLADSTLNPIGGIGRIGIDQVAFSPDGREVAVLEDRTRLVRISLAGGVPREIARLDSSLQRVGGLTWSESGKIVASDGAALWQVSASGGRFERLPVAADAGILRTPRFLPDGRRLIAARVAANPGMADRQPENQSELVIVAPDGRITPVGAQGNYGLVLDSGFLIVIDGSKVWSYPFDGSKGRVSGDPRLVANDANIVFVGAPVVDVSRNGVLVWLNEPSARTEIVVTDRTGRGEPLPLEPGGNAYPRFSPNGTRLAFSRGDNQLSADIWFWDFGTRRATRLTADSTHGAPEWASGGSAIVFNGRRVPDSVGGLGFAALRVRVGGGTPDTLLRGTYRGMRPALLPDGRTVIFESLGAGQPGDIFRATLDSPTVWRPLVSGRSDDRRAAVSPDGRWMAFGSDRTFDRNVYVRRVDGDGETWQVSPDGGDFPRWALGGKELLFLHGDSIFAVRMSEAAQPAFTEPRALFAIPGSRQAEWDVTDDGMRFAFVRPQGTAGHTQVRMLLHAFDDATRASGKP